MNRLLVMSSDLDGTILGCPNAEARFRESWRKLSARQPALLIYNTGRTCRDVLELIQIGRLGVCDCVIGALGTEALLISRTSGEISPLPMDLPEVPRLLVSELAARANAVLQEAQHQSASKASFYSENLSLPVQEELRSWVRTAYPGFKIIYSERRFLDCVPQRAGKGGGLQSVLSLSGIESFELLVAGNSLNDEEMFSLPGVKGIVIKSGGDEFFESFKGRSEVFIARRPFADGVNEGLRFWGFGSG